jgi:hypothetical protein
MTDSQLAMLARSRRPKKHAHWWVGVQATTTLGSLGDVTEEYEECDLCHLRREVYEARQKRGRTSLRAGKDGERAIAKAYGGQRVGQYGGAADVVVGDVLCIQSKVGVSWFPERLWNELQKLPRNGGRIPTLIVSDRPGPGRRTRRLSIRLTEDDVGLLGNEAQDPSKRSVLAEGQDE